MSMSVIETMEAVVTPVIIALGPITAHVTLAINWTEINMAARVCTYEHWLHVDVE